MSNIARVKKLEPFSDLREQVASLVFGKKSSCVYVVQEVAILRQVQEEEHLSLSFDNVVCSDDVRVGYDAKQLDLSREEFREVIGRSHSFVDNLQGHLDEEKRHLLKF